MTPRIRPMIRIFPHWPAIVGLGMLLWLAGMDAAWALPVRVAVVASAPTQPENIVLATVESNGRVTLTAALTGRVLGPLLPAGEVPDGALVARIAPPGLGASISAARARVAFCRNQWLRNRKLYADGVLSRQDVEQAKLTLDESRSALRVLQAQSDQQQLTAPFAGSLHYLVPAGAVVNAGQPIATLAGRGAPWAHAYVTPAVAQGLQMGMVVGLDGSNWRGHGKIRSVGQSARHLGLVSVYIDLPVGSPLLPGEWLQVRLPAPVTTAFVLPTACIVMRGARTEVFAVRHGRAVVVPVHIVAGRGDRTWVSGDLRVGEPVIRSGNARLVAGTPVQVRTP
ncbi:MAG: efflux RND transporter periplasmic adaptor subunit [Acidithiobacillus ferrooxidans]|nr:efflux RND transporter periplasmic adaptor subunit [Acidithiobacillus ferrooxidans]MDD5003358.1 efflux RND transporter periplasmic adaptor subunit [Acidithiobacillus sp.]MDD5377826.1 efflux RND transporter periplasmic adaptor subunit [Acidithiobacillus sp.]MDD5575961.1 efflux RND transporter periplasmic adaptor subunit [Acidithiobacillus sp.]